MDTISKLGMLHITCDNDDQIVSMDLRRRNLAGTLPTELGTLAALTVLDLYDNELSGGIPTQLGTLRDLFYLNLGGNSLTGKIPTEFGIRGI